MKNYFRYLFLTLCFFSIQAEAALLVEPVVGYNLIREVDIKGADKYETGSGWGYGGRLGFQRAGFQIGADYLKSEIDMGSSIFRKNIQSNEYAAFVGYEFPLLLRVYGAYIFSADAETKLGAVKRQFKDGTGGKLGVGFTILPFIDINADYRRISFKNEDIEAVMLSLSLPLELFK